jgi:pimeloyl-ACP methyl ester carboxylesterase
VRLKQEYLSALEARLAADLAVGRHDDVVGELEALVREHPFRERLWAHLMVAQYRGGRQADALATYQRARDVLVSELGLEPGGELRRVEAAILSHDPVLSAPERPPVTASDQIVRSPVRYARCAGGGSVAFQVAGSGPIDILVVPGFVSHLDIWWNAPTDRLVRRLTAIGRLISFDKRGMGLSDRPETIGLDDWMEDALTVLDAVGSERAVVLGVSAGSPTALQLAARHPERVEALVIHGGFGYLISKLDGGRRARMYRFELSDTRKQLLQPVATLPITEQVTAADITADGKQLAVLAHGALYIFPIDGDPAIAENAKPRRIEIPHIKAEGCSFFSDGVLMVAESREVLLARLPASATTQPAATQPAADNSSR